MKKKSPPTLETIKEATEKFQAELDQISFLMETKCVELLSDRYVGDQLVKVRDETLIYSNALLEHQADKSGIKKKDDQQKIKSSISGLGLTCQLLNIRAYRLIIEHCALLYSHNKQYRKEGPHPELQWIQDNYQNFALQTLIQIRLEIDFGNIYPYVYETVSLFHDHLHLISNPDSSMLYQHLLLHSIFIPTVKWNQKHAILKSLHDRTVATLSQGGMEIEEELKAEICRALETLEKLFIEKSKLLVQPIKKRSRH